MSSKIPGIPQNPFDPTFVQPDYIEVNPDTGEIWFGFPGSRVVRVFGEPATKERQPLPKFPQPAPPVEGQPLPPDDSANEGGGNS